MAEVSTIGLDIAKHVFQAHGADASGRVVFRKKIARGKLVEFFASQLRCVVRPKAVRTTRSSWTPSLSTAGIKSKLNSTSKCGEAWH